MYFAGIDIGTQGARVLVVDSNGNPLADEEEPFQPGAQAYHLEPGQFEQSPQAWWEACQRCLRKAASSMERAGKKFAGVAAFSVTSTSGTIVPVDERGVPLRDAIMYNDSRAVVEAQQVEKAGKEISDKLGYRFNSSFALAKILWIKQHEPEVFRRAHLFIHATDYIIGKLTGEFGTTDYSNALKTGYDLMDDRWPSFIETDLEIPISKLPKVVSPGSVINNPAEAICDELGLGRKAFITAGATDGCASQIATGAVSPEDWSTAIGTTLVVKGVSRELIKDPFGRIYSHKHPEGYWLPGGASNTGGECLEVKFGRHRLKELDSSVLENCPSSLVVYPLVREGERFPFVNKDARGFVLGEPASERELYAGYLEGVGYVERLAYETLAGLGAQAGERIFVAGGAAKSRAWLQIRADILQKVMVKPRIATGAMGAAILAASKTVFNNLTEACESLITIESQIDPRPDRREVYDERYDRFVEACRERRYLT